MPGEFQFPPIRDSLLFRFNAAFFPVGRPMIVVKIHDASSRDLQSFAFQELALKRYVRLAKQQSASGTHNAVPRNSASAWTSGHGAPGGSRAAGQFRRSRDYTVGCYSPDGNFFYRMV